MAEHVIDPSRIHHRWDREHEPTLRIASGDVVHFDLLMAGHGQVENGTPIEEARFDFDTLYKLLGPVWVEGAGSPRCPSASDASSSCASA